MKQIILPLSDTQANIETVGGKGMSLAKLANAGLPVPDGFHITTEAYRQFVSANNLQAGIDEALRDVDISRPPTLDKASSEIKRLFTEATIPGDLANAIVSAYGTLPGSNPPVAVRSSATAEDLPDASFAGQQDTYLNISGADDVLEAARKCWASLWTARAIGYRARQSIPSQGVALAVVVQLLIDAEAAGIMFTANPMNGNRDEVVINAAWGLGEAIVGGDVTPDTLTIQKKTGEMVKRETAEKRTMTVRTGSGTEGRPVPDAMKNVPVLSDEKAAELVKIGLKIEELYSIPMDIEWTLADGKFAIVQARPVTALPEAPIEWTMPDPKGSYMRASVIDLMPGPLSPLFVTLWIQAHLKQMHPMCKQMVGSDPTLPKDYLTTINNYAYVNAAMPPKVLWWYFTSLLPAYPKFLRKSASLWRDDLNPKYKAFVASKQTIDPIQLSTERLWHEVQEIVDANAYYVCGLMFATLGASAGSEGLLTMVYNKFAKQNGDPDASALVMGWDNIPVQSEKSLYDIAMWIKNDEELTRYLLETPSDELAEQISPTVEVPKVSNWDKFVAQFQKHLSNFGHIIFQLDFAEPLPLDHPEMMIETIKMYLRGEGTNPHQRQQASEAKRIQTTETILKRLKCIKLWIFRLALKWGQSMAEVREDALAEIGLAYPKLRQLQWELGSRLVKAGSIQDAEDIYWLENDEVSDCVAKLERGETLENYASRVEERRAFYDRVGQITPPPMIPVKERILGIKTDAFIAQTQESQMGNVLKGVATSAGKVTAPAYVLKGPEDFELMRPGGVLVAGTTTPAWTPLFAMASAVVTDIGGPLSHGSIVAREYGIPAVMGTGIATKRIQNGQMITVDGNAGTVTLVEEEKIAA